MEIRSYMSREVVTCTEKETVIGAVRKMAERNIGSIVVVKERRPIGIFTERDLVRRVVARGKDPAQATVGDVMSRDLITVDVSESVGGSNRLFIRRNVRHLPVVEQGRLVGIVSQKDISKALDDLLHGIDFSKHDFSGDY